jgi:hypothetical protein
VVDREHWLALIRLYRNEELVYEGEMEPAEATTVDLRDDTLTLKVEWIRHHTPPDGA